MATVEENIETLSQRMVRDANAEAENVLAAARAKADEIRKRATVQAETERKAILARAQQEAERLRSQAVASAQLRARNDQLASREQLLEQVFSDARARICNIQQWNNYEEIGLLLYKEAISHLQGYPVKVRLDPMIRKLVSQERLEQVAREMQVEISSIDDLEQGCGVVVETTDGHLNYDNTLETRLNRLQNNLRAPVFHILMGEQV
jgi:V/A-type H+-transporting ATPase subunit E